MCFEDINKFMFHQAPMILLTKIISLEHGHLQSLVNIDENSLFLVEGKGVPSYVGVEYMAQTASLMQSLDKSKDAIFGFLLGVRKYKCDYDYFRKNEEFNITAELLADDNGFQSFSCKIFHQINEEKRLIASTNLSVYHDSLEEFKKLTYSL